MLAQGAEKVMQAQESSTAGYNTLLGLALGLGLGGLVNTLVIREIRIVTVCQYIIRAIPCASSTRVVPRPDPDPNPSPSTDPSPNPSPSTPEPLALTPTLTVALALARALALQNTRVCTHLSFKQGEYAVSNSTSFPEPAKTGKQRM